MPGRALARKLAAILIAQAKDRERPQQREEGVKKMASHGNMAAEKAAELSPSQRAVIRNMGSRDVVYPMSFVAADAEVPVNETRRIIRQFYGMGLADRGFLSSEDDSLVRGSGYWLTPLGLDVRAIIEDRAKASTTA